MRNRIINETEEKIVIEPGESLDVFGEEGNRRTMASRRNILKVKEFGERESGVDRVLCMGCGEQVPRRIMELDSHECI